MARAAERGARPPRVLLRARGEGGEGAGAGVDCAERERPKGTRLSLASRPPSSPAPSGLEWSQPSPHRSPSLDERARAEEPPARRERVRPRAQVVGLSRARAHASRARPFATARGANTGPERQGGHAPSCCFWAPPPPTLTLGLRAWGGLGRCCRTTGPAQPSLFRPRRPRTPQPLDRNDTRTHHSRKPIPKQHNPHTNKNPQTAASRAVQPAAAGEFFQNTVQGPFNPKSPLSETNQVPVLSDYEIKIGSSDYEDKTVKAQKILRVSDFFFRGVFSPPPACRKNEPRARSPPLSPPTSHQNHTQQQTGRLHDRQDVAHARAHQRHDRGRQPGGQRPRHLGRLGPRQGRHRHGAVVRQGHRQRPGGAFFCLLSFLLEGGEAERPRATPHEKNSHTASLHPSQQKQKNRPRSRARPR